jgi:hypothetical protein
MPKSKRINGFVEFYKRYNAIIQKESNAPKPQKVMKNAAEMWHKMPETIRNSFTQYSDNERRLRSTPVVPTSPVVSSDELLIIIDDYSFQPSSEEPPADTTEDFDEFIDYDAGSERDRDI